MDFPPDRNSQGQIEEGAQKGNMRQTGKELPSGVSLSVKNRVSGPER